MCRRLLRLQHLRLKQLHSSLQRYCPARLYNLAQLLCQSLLHSYPDPSQDRDLGQRTPHRVLQESRRKSRRSCRAQDKAIPLAPFQQLLSNILQLHLAQAKATLQGQFR